MNTLTYPERISLEMWLLYLKYDKEYARAQYISSYHWRYHAMQLIEFGNEPYVYAYVNEEDMEFADFLDDNGFKVKRNHLGAGGIEVVRNDY